MIQITLTFDNEADAIAALQLLSNKRQQVEVNNNVLTPIHIWLTKYGDNMSIPLYNTLANKDNQEGEYGFKYVETINRKQFLSHRQAGIKRWREFEELRNHTIYGSVH